jgi:hypothetical protein
MKLIMNVNFLVNKKNVGKVKTQLIMALSRNECPNPINLKLTLQIVGKLIDQDAPKLARTFVKQASISKF